MSTSYISKSGRLLQTLGLSALLAAAVSPAMASSVSANFNTAHKLYLKWTKDQKPEYLFEALTHLRNAEGQDPKNTVVLQWIGYIHILQHNYALAVDPLTRVAGQSQQIAQPLINLGYCYYKLARYSDAVNAFTKAERANAYQLGKTPKSELFRINSYQIYSNLGSSLFHTKDYTGAVAAFQRAITANSAIAPGASTNREYRALNIAARPLREAHIQDGLGAALAAQGNITAAITSFQRASQLQPGNGKYEEDLGRAYANAAITEPAGSPSAFSLWTKASVTDAKALQLDPNNYQIQEANGIALVELHKYHQAEQQFALAEHNRSSSAGAGSPGFDVLFHHGEACLNTGQLAKAQALFVAAADLKPQEPVAWQWAGYTALKQGDNSTAIKYLSKAQRIDATSPKILLNLGEAQFQSGDFSGARTTYSKLVQVAPDSADAFYGLGNSCVKTGSMNSAAKAYAQAVKLDPDSKAIPNGLAYVGLGYSLLHSNRPVDAQAAYSRALNIAPDNIDASTVYALASTEIARSSGSPSAWALAATSLQRAVSLSPADNDLRIAYGEALLRSHQNPQAQVALMKAVTASPTNEVALKLLARSQQNLGDITGETQTLGKLVAAAPNNVSYQQLLANAQMVQLDYSGAVPTLTKIVAAEPQNLVAAFQLYTALNHTGHKSQAFKVLENAAAQPGPSTQKAIIYNALGDETFNRAHSNNKAKIKAAQRYFYDALAADHNSNDAMRGLGITALKLGAYKHAIEFLTRALKINPDDAPTYVARGYAYEQLQNIKMAITNYRIALKIDPQNAEARANLQRFAIVPKA